MTTYKLSDGTVVDFVKNTSKGNIQVRVPTSHPLGAEDPLRIFRPDGTHYKDQTDLTLITSTVTAPSTGYYVPAADYVYDTLDAAVQHADEGDVIYVVTQVLTVTMTKTAA